MSDLQTMTYEVGERIARLTLDRPARGNGLTPTLIAELAACVERADLDPEVHVLLLAGAGKGFCGGYDLVESAERDLSGGVGETRGPAETPGYAGETRGPAETSRRAGETRGPAETSRRATETGGPVEASRPVPHAPAGSPLDPAVIAANHNPGGTWDPMVDYAMMSRNVRAFMTLFHCSKPVVCKVHGFCVAGGTDMALCSDLLMIAANARIGYPPARVWGSPTTSMWAHRLGPQRAKRLLFTGDCLSGAQALEWGLAIEAPPAGELDERTEVLVRRIAQLPLNQLAMMKLLVNQQTLAQGLPTTQLVGTLFDGVARHTPEGYAFQQRAAAAGFREAVRARDDPFGDGAFKD